MDVLRIPDLTGVPAIDIALDTIMSKKQALIFCSTKKGAESTAEKISVKTDIALDELSLKIEKVLSPPTKQCKRLARCIKGGIAFHHAGLPYGQRKMIEDGFREGIIKVICSTPTLSFGINLPAFRAIVKDLKRYGGRWGMKWIPTLEYQQMAGRAGRPDFNDTHGEAICIASSLAQSEEIVERFIDAGPENIISKLAVEPVLRTHCLSLIATGFARGRKQMVEFFQRTFYGHQYSDMAEIENIILRVLGMLEEWGFIMSSGDGDFMSASEIAGDRLRSTPLGNRVAQLYIDPYTAFQIMTSLRKGSGCECNEFSIISMISGAVELRPGFRIRSKEIEAVEDYLSKKYQLLIIEEPEVYELGYDEFLTSMKTTLVFEEWMDENDEDYLLEMYNVTPGEFRMKLELAKWLLYASEELARLMEFKDLLKMIRKTRYRLKNGIKEELIPLVRLKGIGRKRARILYRNQICDISSIKNADPAFLAGIIGKKTSEKLMRDLGSKFVSEDDLGSQKIVSDY